MWLAIILESSNGSHGLVHASTGTVAWLKLSALLALTKVAHLLLWLAWAIGDALVSPVAVKVAGRVSGMSCTSLALEVA